MLEKEKREWDKGAQSLFECLNAGLMGLKKEIFEILKGKVEIGKGITESLSAPEETLKRFASQIAERLELDKAQIREKLDIWIEDLINKNGYLEDIDNKDMKTFVEALAAQKPIKIREE